MTPPAQQLEPWPGYDGQTETERLDTLEHKVGEARRRGDLLYALAVSVAVASGEALRRGDGAPTQLEQAAENLARKLHEYGAAQLEDAGGWTPK
jgi:hypothetical protein